MRDPKQTKKNEEKRHFFLQVSKKVVPLQSQKQ